MRQGGTAEILRCLYPVSICELDLTVVIRFSEFSSAATHCRRRNVTLLHKIDNNRAHSSSTSAAATTSTIIITIHSHQSLRTDTPKHQQTQLLPAGWSREHNHNVTAVAKMAAMNLKALNL